MARTLVQLYQDVQQDHRGDIDAYFAALDQLSANKRLEALGEQYHFVTFHDPNAFGNWRVMYGPDLADLLYNTREVSTLHQLLKRYKLNFIDIRASGYDNLTLLKQHFGLAKNVSQASFATYQHFLLAGMKGETQLARQVSAYLMAMEREGRIQEEVRTQAPALWEIAYDKLTRYLGPALKDLDAKRRQGDENLQIAIDRERVSREQSIKDAMVPLRQEIEDLKQQFEATQTVAAGPGGPLPRMVNTPWVFLCNRIAMLGEEPKYLPLPLFRASFEAHMRNNYTPVSNGSDEPAYDPEDLKTAYNMPGFGTRKLLPQNLAGDERLSAEIRSFREWYTERKQKSSSPAMPRAVKPPLIYRPREGHGKDSA